MASWNLVSQRDRSSARRLSVTAAGLFVLGCLVTGFSPAPRAAFATEPTATPLPVVVSGLRDFARQANAGRIRAAAATSPHAADAGKTTAAAPLDAAARISVSAEPPLELSVPVAAPIPRRVADARRSTSITTEAAKAAGANDAPATSLSRSDLVAAEVRGMLVEYLRAFRRRDAEAVAACWSETADNRSLDSGDFTFGREQVEEVFQTLFEADGSAEIDLEIQEIRPLGDDVAVVDGISQLSFSTGEATASRFSAVCMKKDGRWLLESVREAATGLPESTRAAAIRRVGEFAGHWESVGQERQASTHAFWTAGGGFLVRSHTLHAAEGNREITEIIGWDPVRQGIRSWSFTSDGGFAEGSWSMADGRCDVMLDGTRPDGQIVTGRMVITRLGADELHTSLTGSGIADLVPPAGDMSRMAR
jgi:uncharacterized protein (TIGR02246 family)